MTADFFSQPILNSPYEYPGRHWELDESGQPTTAIKEIRRQAEFITPIPKPKKRRKSKRQELEFPDKGDISTNEQQYAHTQLINELRWAVDDWRTIPDSSKWKVTPETARLLQHWRDYPFQEIRPNRRQSHQPPRG